MERLKKYFSVETPQWQTTVKYCFKIGLLLGLLIGVSFIIYLTK